MNEQARCRFVASDQPRVLNDRHREDCPGDCRGCLPCPMDHCRVCGIEHSSGACGGCLAEVRESLTDVRRMTRALPAEVEHRGVESEAMNLAGPSADPEAWEHRAASSLAGRIVLADCDARDLEDLQAWLDQAEGELHPLWVLGTWAMVYADALEHDLGDEQTTVASAADYLDRHLTEIAAHEWVPFEDMARDLRRCVGHMERVLHDGEQIDRGVPCMNCGRLLERVWGYGNKQDGWECKRCREFSTEDQYRFAVTADYIAHADWLTDLHMAVRTGVKAGTVRVWAQRDLIARRLDSGRVVYSVTDVEARRDARTLAS